MKKIRKLYSYFSKPTNLTVLNGILIAILIGLNILLQAFCIPTTWAIILLTICFLNTIFSPLLEKTKLAPLISFINGVSLFVFMYCIIFIGKTKLLVLLMIFTGLVFFIPHFFVVQLLWRNIFKPLNKTSRYYFMLAIMICIGTVIYIGQEYQEAIKSIDKFKQSNYTELDKNFMTEKILGMHFIYHTRLCIYDGWRPPKHELILVIGMWLNGGMDPLNVDLKTRLELYKKFFPKNKYKFDCSCGIQYSEYYHNDSLWK